MSEQVKPLDLNRRENQESWKFFRVIKESDIFMGALIPLLIVTIWQFIGTMKFVSPLFLPTPAAILSTIGDLIVSKELSAHLVTSTGRVVLGFFIGGSLGLLFGCLTGLSRKAGYVIDPSVQLLRMIPHLAIAPLIILWFGFGEVSKIFIIANGAFFPLYLNTFMGIRNVDNKLFEVSRVLEFNRYKTLFNLILPASLPNIFLGLRLSLGVSWLGLVVAELLGSTKGIGFLINIGQQNSVTELIFVGIIIFAVVGKLVDSFVRVLERKFLSWRDHYQG